MLLTELTQTLPLAYIGPGSGLGLIGALIMLIVAVLGALFFVVLYPLRMLFRSSGPAEEAADPPAGPQGEQPGSVPDTAPTPGHT